MKEILDTILTLLIIAAFVAIIVVPSYIIFKNMRKK